MTPDFVHTGPFGRLEGRDAYLAADLSREIRFYYDPAPVRDALSPEDQDTLGGVSGR